MRAELPHREPLTMHANRPLKDIACVLHAQTKDATVVCVIGCQITTTRIHTLPKRLASARPDYKRKTVILQELHASNKTVSEDEEEHDVFSLRPLYCGHAGSDIIGCRRQTGGVFTYVSSDTSHAEGVPHSDP